MRSGSGRVGSGGAGHGRAGRGGAGQVVIGGGLCGARRGGAGPSGAAYPRRRRQASCSALLWTRAPSHSRSRTHTYTHAHTSSHAHSRARPLSLSPPPLSHSLTRPRPHAYPRKTLRRQGRQSPHTARAASASLGQKHRHDSDGACLRGRSTLFGGPVPTDGRYSTPCPYLRPPWIDLDASAAPPRRGTAQTPARAAVVSRETGAGRWGGRLTGRLAPALPHPRHDALVLDLDPAAPRRRSRRRRRRRRRRRLLAFPRCGPGRAGPGAFYEKQSVGSRIGVRIA